MSVRETATYSFDHQLFTNPFPPVDTEEIRQINEIDAQLEAEETELLSFASHLPSLEKRELEARIRADKMRLREHLASMIARKFSFEKVHEELSHSKYILGRSVDDFFAKRNLNSQIEQQVEDEFNTFERRLKEVDAIAIRSFPKIQTPTEKKLDEDPLWGYKWDAVHRNMETAKMGAKLTEITASALSVPISAVCNFPAPNACKNLLDVGKTAAKGAIQAMGLEKAVGKASDVIDALSSDQALVQNLETQFLIPREQGKEYAREAFQSLAPLPPFELHRFKEGEFIAKVKDYINEYYDPGKEDAIRNAMIRTSIKTGMHYILAQHPITALAHPVGYAAENLKPCVELLKCPKLEDERIHAMYMLPSCQETKDTLLRGLELAQYPKKLLHDAEEFICECTIGQADRLGITEKNIEQIAGVAHQLIMQKAPQTLKKAYEDWIKSPISNALNPNLTAKLSANNE